MRRYPRIDGPAVLPLFCLAPHGVFRASRITPRAVSSYLAFSPLPALRCQRTGGVFSVTLSVGARLGERRPRVLRGMLPYGVRTFLPALCNPRSTLTDIGRRGSDESFKVLGDHLPSCGSYHIVQRRKSIPRTKISRGISLKQPHYVNRTSKNSRFCRTSFPRYRSY